MPPRPLSHLIAEIAFIGRSGGAVKTLPGFKKGHHTLPDVANAVTNGFLAKICESELASDAEQLFQGIREALGYKRRDLSLVVSSPVAMLQAKHFALEIQYALDETQPASYAVTTTLRNLDDAELARGAPLNDVFAGRFSEISFALQKGASVEAVVDAIESLDGEGGFLVTYPSDCHECTIRMAGVDAEVRCTGASLDLVFPRAGSPAELIAAFTLLREAFQISKVLAGLIG